MDDAPEFRGSALAPLRGSHVVSRDQLGEGDPRPSGGDGGRMAGGGAAGGCGATRGVNSAARGSRFDALLLRLLDVQLLSAAVDDCPRITSRAARQLASSSNSTTQLSGVSPGAAEHGRGHVSRSNTAVTSSALVPSATSRKKSRLPAAATRTSQDLFASARRAARGCALPAHGHTGRGLHGLLRAALRGDAHDLARAAPGPRPGAPHQEA